jgi:hypothetical protein
VPIELDACDVCGARFLNDAQDDLRLPLIGSAKDLDSGKKAWIMVGGAVGIIATFLIVALLIGLVI